MKMSPSAPMKTARLRRSIRMDLPTPSTKKSLKHSAVSVMGNTTVPRGGFRSDTHTRIVASGGNGGERLRRSVASRGEVVVVNEKFGIRLTDIISPLERIESLK